MRNVETPGDNPCSVHCMHRPFWSGFVEMSRNVRFFFTFSKKTFDMLCFSVLWTKEKKNFQGKFVFEKICLCLLISPLWLTLFLVGGHKCASDEMCWWSHVLLLQRCQWSIQFGINILRTPSAATNVPRYEFSPTTFRDNNYSGVGRNTFIAIEPFLLPVGPHATHFLNHEDQTILKLLRNWRSDEKRRNAGR